MKLRLGLKLRSEDRCFDKETQQKKTDIKKYDTLPKAIDEFYLAVNEWVI